MAHQCKNNHLFKIEDMTLKMGGLLCPMCRTIVYAPYVDEEYFQEVHRRRAESEKEEKDESDSNST